MGLTRKAGLVPEVNEHLEYHVHSHLDIFINGKKAKIPAGIGIDTNRCGVFGTEAELHRADAVG